MAIERWSAIEHAVTFTLTTVYLFLWWMVWCCESLIVQPLFMQFSDSGFNI